MPSHVETVRGVYEALGRGDAQPLMDVMHPDLVWIEPDGAPGVGAMSQDSGTYNGSQATMEGVFGRLPEFWSEFSSEPDDFLDAGDHVIVMGHLRATAPETGNPVAAPSCHVWRFEDDKLVWWRCYEDTALLHVAKGTLSP